MFFIIINSLIFLCIYLWWKKSRVKTVPCLQLTFPLGHGRYLNYFAPGIGLPIRILEILAGASRIFKNEGMFYVRLFHIDCVFLTRAETVKDLIGVKDHFAKLSYMDPMKIFLGEGLITTSGGDRWKFHRKFVNQHLGIKSLAKYQTVMVEQSVALCKKLSDVPMGSAFSIYPYLVHCSFSIAVGSFTGHVPGKGNTQIKLLEKLEEFFSQSLMNPLVRFDILYSKITVGREYQQLSKEFRNFFEQLLDKRRSEIKGAFSDGGFQKGNEIFEDERVSIMDSFIIGQLTNNSFKDEEIIDDIITLIAAAYDTTATALVWAIYFIGYYPEVQRKVHQELDDIFGTDMERDTTSQDVSQMKYLLCVYKESMRLYPPAPVFGRKLPQDTEIGGRMIPKGTDVAVFINEVHRDPKYFEDPEEFRPERFSPENQKALHPCAYVPFSYGQRNCVGNSYALKSGVTMLSSILRKFSVQSIQQRDKLPVIWGITGKPHSDILLKLFPKS